MVVEASDEQERLFVPYLHAVGFTANGPQGGSDTAIILPADDEPLCDAQRLEVARAIGFSETVFITTLHPSSSRDGVCDVSLRYFTPMDEVSCRACASRALCKLPTCSHLLAPPARAD